MLCSRIVPIVILGLSCLTDALPFNAGSDATGTTSNRPTGSRTPSDLTTIDPSSLPVAVPREASRSPRADATGGEHLVVKVVNNLSLDQLYGVSVGVPPDTTLYITVRSDKGIGSITAHDGDSRKMLARTALPPGTRQASLAVDPEQNARVHFTVYLVEGYGAPIVTVVSRKRAPPTPAVSPTDPSAEPSGARRRLIWRDSSVPSPAASADEQVADREAAPAQPAGTVAAGPPSDIAASVENSPTTNGTGPNTASSPRHPLHSRSSPKPLVSRADDAPLFPGERLLLRLPIGNSCRTAHDFVFGVKPGKLMRIRITGQKKILGISARATEKGVQLARFPLEQDAGARARPSSATLDVDPRGSASVRLHVEFLDYNGPTVILVTEFDPTPNNDSLTGNATDVEPISDWRWGKDFDFLIDGSVADDLFSPESCQGAPSNESPRPSQAIRPRSPPLSPPRRNERLIVKFHINKSRRKGHSFSLGVLPGKALRIEVSTEKTVASISVRSRDDVKELAHFWSMENAQSDPHSVAIDLPPQADTIVMVHVIFVETTIAATILAFEYDPPAAASPVASPAVPASFVMSDGEFASLLEQLDQTAPPVAQGLPPPEQVNHPAPAAAQGAPPPPVNQPGPLPPPNLPAPAFGIPLPQAPPPGPSPATKMYVAANPFPESGSLPRVWPAELGSPPPHWPLVPADSQAGAGGMPVGASNPSMPQGLVPPMMTHPNVPPARGHAPGAAPLIGSQMVAPGAPPLHNPPAAPGAPLAGPAWSARLPVNLRPAPGAPQVGPAWSGVPSFNQPGAASGGTTGGAAPGAPPAQPLWAFPPALNQPGAAPGGPLSPNPPAAPGVPPVQLLWALPPALNQPGAAPGILPSPNPPAAPGAPPVPPMWAAPPAINQPGAALGVPSGGAAPGAPPARPSWAAPLAVVDPNAPLPQHQPAVAGPPADDLLWSALPPRSLPSTTAGQSPPLDPRDPPARLTWDSPPPASPPAAGGDQNAPGPSWGGTPPLTSPAAPLTPLAGTSRGGAGLPSDSPTAPPGSPDLGNLPAFPGAWLTGRPAKAQRRPNDWYIRFDTLRRRSPPL